MKLSIAFILLLAATTTFSQSKTPKAVFIILDGIPADVIEKLHPPTLFEIAKVGGYTRSYTGGITGTYNETPTISAPGYNNLITGVWGNKHNVWDNDDQEPNYNYWNIFRIAETIKPSLKTAVFSTWVDNRTVLVGEGLDAAGNIKLDYSFDGLELDTITYPHDKGAVYIRKIDDAVAAHAAQYITTSGPDLSWVYLEFTDDMGHRYGDSEQLHEAVFNADQHIKKIWDAITLRQQSMNEDWLIVITTDHGRTAFDGKGHGGQSERERTTWIFTNSNQLNKHFTETPAVVDILPSVTQHLKLQIPEETARELDGIPFIGTVDFSDLKAVKKDGKILVTWKNLATENKNVEIYLAVTNHYKTGESDSYLKVGEVPVKQQKYPISFQSNSEIFKIVLKTKTQTANVWVAPSKKSR